MKDLRAKPNILIVDDEPEIRAVIAETLGSEFFIQEASSGVEALRVLAKSQIDLLIADFTMPGMNGLELVERIRNFGTNPPIVMLTGRGSSELEMQVVKLRSTAYCEKPFNAIALRHMILNALGMESGLRTGGSK